MFPFLCSYIMFQFKIYHLQSWERQQDPAGQTPPSCGESDFEASSEGLSWRVRCHISQWIKSRCLWFHYSIHLATPSINGPTWLCTDFFLSFSELVAECFFVRLCHWRSPIILPNPNCGEKEGFVPGSNFHFARNNSVYQTPRTLICISSPPRMSTCGSLQQMCSLRL